MDLGDFGSIASIISLIVGFSACRLMMKYSSQLNKIFSIFNFGTISQKNKKKD